MSKQISLQVNKGQYNQKKGISDFNIVSSFLPILDAISCRNFMSFTYGWRKHYKFFMSGYNIVRKFLDILAMCLWDRYFPDDHVYILSWILWFQPCHLFTQLYQRNKTSATALLDNLTSTERTVGCPYYITRCPSLMSKNM